MLDLPPLLFDVPAAQSIVLVVVVPSPNVGLDVVSRQQLLCRRDTNCMHGIGSPFANEHVWLESSQGVANRSPINCGVVTGHDIWLRRPEVGEQTQVEKAALLHWDAGWDRHGFNTHASQGSRRLRIVRP